MLLLLMALTLTSLPFAPDPAVFSPGVLVQMLAQLSMLALSIDYLRHEDAFEPPNPGRRATDR